ncbi:MAG TPA: GMP synthase (glutamine-hydrolyzing) [Lentisphaeria bacterium]|jgi:GMP synthase (glutamine-hydrolysing)|nr:GMP synthase (glutamine-hydrolyzing) [Lentisphaeria bacterium]
MSVNSDQIIILDFGSQYTQLIARRVRELNVFSDILRYDTPAAEIRARGARGIILSGGPASVYAENSPQCCPELFDLGLPILGVCYGLQLMVHRLGGSVDVGLEREFGLAKLSVHHDNPLFANVPDDFSVWMSHGDKVHALPEGFRTVASTGNAEFAAIADTQRKFFGIQFHPEVVHSEHGSDLFRNFAMDVCGCTGSWTMESFVERSVREIQQQVGDEGEVILGLSGGVDSSVAAALIHKAIGSRLHCVFVNNGLCREGEAEAVVGLFGRAFQMNLHVVDATERFIGKLAGVIEPEAKRKIIGYEFVDVFDDKAKTLPKVSFLAQGTTYPDVIESVPIGDNPSSMIKSHHNVGGLPETMDLDLVEPLRQLFKDEVREVGRQLGLPKEAVMRQPFPGPGLGVRILGEVTSERLEILRKADTIVLQEMKAADLYYKVWQSFAVLLPVQTVGVMGDERTYENVCALRIVDSQDGMTADWVRVPYELLGRMANRIINEVRGINRVCLDISSKPPSTIEWE